MKELIGETQEPKKAEKPQQRATYVSNLPKKEHQSSVFFHKKQYNFYSKE